MPKILFRFVFLAVGFSFSLSRSQIRSETFFAIYDRYKCTLKHFSCSPFCFGYGKWWCLHLVSNVFVSSKVKSIAKSFAFAFISFSMWIIFGFSLYCSISEVYEFSPATLCIPHCGELLTQFGCFFRLSNFLWQKIATFKLNYEFVCCNLFFFLLLIVSNHEGFGYFCLSFSFFSTNAQLNGKNITARSLKCYIFIYRKQNW